MGCERDAQSEPVSLPLDSSFSPHSLLPHLTVNATAAEPVFLRAAPGLEEKRRLAEVTCALFDEHNRREHSCSDGARKGYFISPHEDLAAVRYLGNLEHA